MSNENSSQLGTILTAFVVGAIAGAGIALLYAPGSGRETRDLLARRTRELKSKVSDSLDDAKEMLSEKKAMIAAAFEAGKQAMNEKKAKDSNPA
jgi:gas vesicle protein